jgi:hypothetical protein
VRQLPAGGERAALASGLARNLAWQNPSEAANWAAFIGTESQEFQSLAGNIAGAWANQDPSAASEWLGTLPEGEARNGAITAFLHSAARNQPDLAAAWALVLPEGPQRQSHVQMIYSQWSHDDPTAAAQWLRSADVDDALRNRLLQPPGQE